MKEWTADAPYNSDFSLGDIIPVLSLSKNKIQEKMIIRKIVTEEFSYKGNQVIVKVLKVEAGNGLLYYASFNEKNGQWMAMGSQDFEDWKKCL